MKLWIVDDGSSYDTCLAIVRTETLEDAKRLLGSRWRVHFDMPDECNREIPDGEGEAVLWIYERSYDPRSD